MELTTALNFPTDLARDEINTVVYKSALWDHAQVAYTVIDTLKAEIARLAKYEAAFDYPQVQPQPPTHPYSLG